MTPTQIKLIAYISIVLISISGLFFTGYHYGFKAADTKYAAQIQEYNDTQIKSMVEIQSLAAKILSNTSAYNTKISKDIDQIKAAASKEVLVVYKDGKCVITPAFLEARKAAIERANQ